MKRRSDLLVRGGNELSVALLEHLILIRSGMKKSSIQSKSRKAQAYLANLNCEM